MPASSSLTATSARPPLTVTFSALPFEFELASGNPRAKPQHSRLGLANRRRGHDDGKFFAAVAGHDVHLPARFAKRAGDAAEHFVAGQVAMNVVEFLEVIDVDHHQAEGSSATLKLGQSPAQFRVERPAVCPAGQGVGHGVGGVNLDLMRLFLQLALGRFQLLLQPAVGLNDLGDGAEDNRFEFAVFRHVACQFVADFLNARRMLAHVGRDATRQFMKLRQGVASPFDFFRFRTRAGVAVAAQPPADAHPGQQLDHRHDQREQDQRM